MIVFRENLLKGILYLGGINTFVPVISTIIFWHW